MKNVVLFMTFILSSSLALGQANSTASGEKALDYLMGGASAAAGGVIMAKSCNPTGWMMCMVGASLIVSGIMDISQGAGRQGTIDNTSAGTPNTANGDGYGGLPADLPPAIQSAVQDALTTAKAAGINPQDPASMAALASQAGVANDASDSGSPGSGNPMSLLSAAQQAEVKKAMNDAANKFHISSVALEDGAGGGGLKKGKSDDGLDLASLMDGLNKKDDRGPASVEGLAKSFNGNSIGVAGDDIFKQVSRRYQAKIQAKAFIMDGVLFPKGK